MEWKRATPIFLAATLGASTVLRPGEKHIDPRQCQEPPTATYENGYSTVAPPTFLDAGLWECMPDFAPPLYQRGDFPQYVSSLVYHPLPSCPLAIEPDHYEPNVRAHVVTGNLQPEREVDFLATPFHPGPIENVEAAASTPVVFAGFDRKILGPSGSVVITAHRPSKQNLWVQRRRNARGKIVRKSYAKLSKTAQITRISPNDSTVSH